MHDLQVRRSGIPLLRHRSGWVSSLAPDPSFPQVPPAEKHCSDGWQYTTWRRSVWMNDLRNIEQHFTRPCGTLRIRACNTQKLHEPAHVLIHACWRSSRVKPKHVYMSTNSWSCLLTTLFEKACRLMRHDRDRKPAKFNLRDPALLIGRYCQLSFGMRNSTVPASISTMHPNSSPASHASRTTGSR